MADEEKDYQQDYYQMLKDESYKSLLSKEVQLNNARERALKQTNVGLNAMGLGSSGYGQTARTGIEGQYLSALEGANQTYQQEQTDIGLQQLQYQQQQDQAAANQQYQDFAGISNLLTATGNKQDLDYLMDKYGLYTNGQFDYDKAVALYGEENAKQLDYLYRLQSQGIEDMEYGNIFAGTGDYASASKNFVDQNGNTGKMNDELKRFFDPTYDFAGKTGYNPQNGDVVKISGNDKQGAPVIYIVYRNGNWYQTTAERYNSAANTHWFRSEPNSGSTYKWDDKTYKDWGK